MARNKLAYLDTHVLVRLYLGHAEKLSSPARRVIEGCDLLVSPAAMLELEFLHEIGRLKPAATELFGVLSADIGVRLCDLPFPRVAGAALQEGWSRDPFDRLIVAQAKVNNLALVTRDETIQANYRLAVW